MNNIQTLGLKLIADNVSDSSRIFFKDRFFDFYDDTSGQRDHVVSKYKCYGKISPDHYIVHRKLSFTNKIDEDKDGAILGIFDLTKCTVISIEEESVEFDTFTIKLKWK